MEKMIPEDALAPAAVEPAPEGALFSTWQEAVEKTAPDTKMVVFDLDGTLVDTESLAVTTGLRAFAEVGHLVDERFMHGLVGKAAPQATEIIRGSLPGIDLEAFHAAWRLGVLIDGGQITGELEEAVAFFRVAAERDYINAIVSLAVMQATGRGTAQDFGAAMGNYMRAAQLGDSHGVRGVAVMLLLGEGVAADPEEAAAWFLVSAAMGNCEADANLEQVLDDLPNADFPVIGARAIAIAEELGLDVPIYIEEEAPIAPMAT
jgi:hypothetical protein